MLQATHKPQKVDRHWVLKAIFSFFPQAKKRKRAERFAMAWMIIIVILIFLESYDLLTCYVVIEAVSTLLYVPVHFITFCVLK